LYDDPISSPRQLRQTSRPLNEGPTWLTDTLPPLPDAYTLNAIGQDDFEDVKVPDAPAKPASTPAKK
jgi:hypothetical protein